MTTRFDLNVEISVSRDDSPASAGRIVVHQIAEGGEEMPAPDRFVVTDGAPPSMRAAPEAVAK